jgi:(S)-citramalyl-CoA lyase
MFASAEGAGADAVVLDLEDAVSESRKDAARIACTNLVNSRKMTNYRLGVRINPVDTIYASADIRVLAPRSAPLDFVVVPMVESFRDIEIVDRWLSGFDCRLDIYVVLETAVGIERAFDICRNSPPSLKGILAGTADYASDIHAFVDQNKFVFMREAIVNAARAAHLDVIDAPLFNLDDEIRLQKSSRQSFRTGFAGRAAIHPVQVPLINDAYRPTLQDLEYAQEILDNAKTAEGGVTRSRDGMIGKPFVTNARRLIALAELHSVAAR